MLAPGTVASSPRSIRMGDICLSVENVLFDQDDYDVAGLCCVVIAVTKREWRRPSPPFLPTPVPTPNPTYT